MAEEKAVPGSMLLNHVVGCSSVRPISLQNASVSAQNKQSILDFYSVDEFPEKSSFSIYRSYPALSVPARMTATLRQSLRLILLQKPKTKNVYVYGNNNNRRLLLLRNPNEYGEEKIPVDKFEEFYGKDPILSKIMASKTSRRNHRFDGAGCGSMENIDNDDNYDSDAIRWHVNNDDSTCLFTIKQTYDEMSAEEVFGLLFADNKSLIPSSFEIIGQIAHLNLRDEQLRYKYWIGSIILEKNQPAIRTVVNKIGSIENAFRTFPMEVLAGYGYKNIEKENDWSITVVKQEGCTFQLDFRTVYWNSRLSGEHKRLVNLIQKDAIDQVDRSDKRNVVVVADMMCGIGPFAIPLTVDGVSDEQKKNQKKSPRIKQQTSGKLENIPNVRVYANDLNPESFKYLKINSKLNKCNLKKLFCYNLDARMFLMKLQDDMLLQNDAKNVNIDHVLMNLPASAPEFLDSFRGWKLDKLPRIHVYCFAPKPQFLLPEKLHDPKGTTYDSSKMTPSTLCTLQDTYNVALNRCSKALGCLIDWDAQNVDVHLVRDVSPGKNMICVSFTLPEQARNLIPLNLRKRDNVNEIESFFIDEGNSIKGQRRKVDNETGYSIVQ